MAKRRFISFLPAWNQTDELTNFFGTTIDEVFQPGISDSITGYIGRIPTYANPVTDFSVTEPTSSRQKYQLEASMVSIDTNAAITNALTYPDFVSHLGTDGANTIDHQRMFETDYYSWAPPINIDMISNYREYYWFGDQSGAVDLPTLVLNVPMNNFVGDGSTTTFALPAAINAVASGDEVPTVYVNSLPVSATHVGNNMVCAVAPANGAAVLVCRTPNLFAAISGQTNVDISDINSEGVETLTSTMRIKIIDALYVIGAWDIQPWDFNLWDVGGNGVYMVDGIGLSLRLTPDSYMIRDTKPQYVTIDRSSVYPNLWSYHNSWVHKDSFAWANVSFPRRQATRPIIEFIRDIVFYPGQVWEEDIDPLFMLYDLNGFALNDPIQYPLSDFVGNRIFGYMSGNSPIDTVLNRHLSYDNNGYPLFENEAFSKSYTYKTSSGTFPITSLYCYGTASIVSANFVGSISGTTLTVTSVVTGSLEIGQTIVGSNINKELIITDFISATGGTGTYQLNDSVSINSESMFSLSLEVSSLWHKEALPTVQDTDSNLFFNLPLGLQANPSSDDVTTISRSTWIEHFQSLIINQDNFIGQPLADNNYRDSKRDLSVGKFILQHRAPLLKTMLISSDASLDLPQSIRYSEQEYNKFRNKFVRKLTVIDEKGLLANVDPTVDPDTWVTTALFEMNRNQNSSFPFALSTMGGGQYFIPPTPTYLGVLPATIPAWIVDDTIYASPTTLLRGHDGSLTPLFGDWRDNVMLALEQRIYDNLEPDFKTENRPAFDIATWMGNKFIIPINGYYFSEISEILNPMFEIWVQRNHLDYRSNPDYDYSDPFTWNYNGVKDIFSNPLPGNWRAIYRYYYDTDAPHSRPWEMLGFTSEPSWWSGAYGSAPYVRSNTMWSDLETGTIVGGPRIGTDARYARPGLSDLIPVDDSGNLLNPIDIGIVTTNIPISVSSRSWQPGDHSPIENIWINSPSYKYALALAAFLMKPSRFTEECWDHNIGFIGDQWVNINSNLSNYLARPLNSQQYLHGEKRPDGTTAVIIGLQQWICDYIVSTGTNVTTFGNKIRGLAVRLAHQMAGFVSSDEVKLLADNFGLLPSEDINVFLYTSPATDVEVYSGVILQWTGSAWRVLGYDARNPEFTIIPPDLNGPKGLISLATAAEPALVPWKPNTYYPINILVVHLGSVYQSKKSHTGGSQFEDIFWIQRPDVNTSAVRAPRVITYKNGLNTTISIPYGTEFDNYQDIANFLLGWQRYLVSRGWIFDALNQDNEVMNWELSVREFLTWAQIQWQAGNFIALSPGNQGLKFSTSDGTILNVEDNITGFFGLLDRSGAPIRQTSAQINRLDGQITIAAINADIYCARLEIADIEHLLIVDNVTIFNDDIYLPLFNMRQDRLLLVCNRGPQWAGRLDAPGFMIIGNTLKSNFDKSSNDVRYMFDIELADNKELRDYARHNIAFQERSYLNNLLIDDVEQFEFYQGMIQQKGAPGVFKKLMRSTLASSNSNTQFLEEWAFLLGEYGSPIDPFITFQITQTDARIDPQLVRFTTTPNAPLTWISLPLVNSVTGTNTTATLVKNDTFVLNGYTVVIKTAPYNIPDVVTDINNLKIPHIVASTALSGAIVIRNTIGGSIVLETGIGIPLQTLGLNVGTFNIDQWIDRPASSNFFKTTTDKYSLPTAGPVRLSDADNYVFHISQISNTYDTQVADDLIPFAANTRTWVYERLDGTYTVLESFDTGSSPNKILKVITNHEDISVTDTRIQFQNTMNLTNADVGNYLIIDGQSRSNPELKGVAVISSVNVGGNYVDIETIGTEGHDFTSDLTNAPIVRVLREVRFANMSALLASPITFFINDMAWIDDDGFGKWMVVQWDGSTWVAIRNQPLKINSLVVSETVLYHEQTQLNIASQELFINEPIVPDLNVIDPLCGLIAGISELEIYYKSPYDPARYNSGNSIANNVWGDEQVGRVWWNTSTVKFLEPYTDIIGASNTRDIDELSYRTINWAQIAPNTSVDVYEWTKTTVSPQSYNGPGTLLTDSDGVFIGNWVELIEYNPIIQKNVTYFFYWIKDLTTKPNVDFRNIPVATVAAGITNPSGLDLAWMAPVNTDALIFSGIIQYLNDIDTVIKVRLTLDTENQGRHNEWVLLRPTDQTTLPTDIMWYDLKNSLAAFNRFQNPLPSPALAPTRNTGINFNQNIFVIDPKNNGSRSGLMDAREAFVGSVNNIFSKTPIARERQIYLDTIYRSQTINPTATWTQIDKSYPYENPPSNEWDVQVFTLNERNRLVARQDFLNAVTDGRTIRVLLNVGGNPVGLQSWSIWNFNPDNAAAVIAAYPLLDPSIALLQNVDNPAIADADQIFTLALSYEHSVNSMSARDALTIPVPTISVGDRVLVTSDTSTFGFWSIWKYEPSDPTADAAGYILWRVQAYRTDDFISVVDWYDTGYSANNPPIVSYATIADRNNAESTSFANTFVKVNDDGTGKWIWTVLEKVIGTNGPIEIPEIVYPTPPEGISLVWKTVAIQDGTIEFSSNFYDPSRVVHGLNTLSVTDIENRDGSWELYILLQALRYAGMLLDTEINTIWFDMINFCYTQQADINWAFKTSFMSIVGYNVPLTATPFVVPDQTNYLLSYVNEIKPYRVKIREFSTQYSTDIDNANVTVTDFDKPVYFDPILGTYRVLDPILDAEILQTLPWKYWYDNYLAHPELVRGIDVTMLFDRYASELENWDEDPWDVVLWDNNEDLTYDHYVHTIINENLIAPSQTISVDDVTYFTDSFATLPVTIKIGDNTYQIGTVTRDDVNISTTLHGNSGKLKTVSGTISTLDGTANNVVEAIIPIPSAASRIISYYNPTATMAPKDLTLLMNLDRPSTTITYPTTVAVANGATVLTFASTIGILKDQGVAGPNIIRGTSVVDFSSTTVTLSQGTIGEIFSGTNIVFNLPNWIDGYQLHNLSSPSDFDTIGFDTGGFDIVVSNFNDTVFDGGQFYKTTATSLSGSFTLTFSHTDNSLIGQIVSGTNILSGTTVVSVNTMTNVVTISQPISGNIASGTEIRFYSFPGIDINPGMIENTPGSWAGLYIGTSTRATNAMRDPYFSINHPEERVPFTADDGLQMIITAQADIGGPSQIIKEFNVSDYGTSTATLFFDLIAQAGSATMVFCDGVRQVYGTDYSVDYFNRTVTVNISGVDFVQIHAFGFGGTSQITETHFIDFQSNPITLENTTTLSNIMVVQDGIIQTPGVDYTLSGGVNVTLTTPPSSGTDVAIVVFDGGTSTATLMDTQTLVYSGGPQQWTLAPNDTDSVPEHGGTIVEVNGLRITPLVTWYGEFTADQPWLFMPKNPDNLTTVTVYMNGVLYTHSIPFCYDVDPMTSTFPFFIDGGSFALPPVVPGRFVIFNDNLLVSLDPTFTGTVAVVLDFPAEQPDYTVTSSVLDILTPTLSGSDLIQATVFTNSSVMGLETVVYDVGSVAQYFVPMPFAKDYAMVTMNGVALAPDFDYEIYSANTGWDSVDWDDVPFDLSFETGVLDIFAPISGKIVATIVTKASAREEIEWRMINSGPAFDRMHPILDDMGNQVFVNRYAHNYPVYDSKFDYFRQSPYMAGVLTNPLYSTDNTIDISLFIKQISPKLQEDNPLMQPTPNNPGVIWIGGERIEYFTYNRSGDNVTLQGLRRGTRGTCIAEQRLVTTGTGNGSPQTYILDATHGTGPLEVTIDGVPSLSTSHNLVGSQYQVVLTAPVGSFVTVAYSIGFVYQAGTKVYNGSEELSFPLPIGPDVGNRELAPLHNIIEL